MPLPVNDIAPGLVVTLDTDVLRARGDCQTNAERSGEQDRAVTGVQSFLLLAVDTKTGGCTAVPVFAKSAVGNQPLDNRRKSGDHAEWRAAASFFSRWQHWRMPVDAVVAAYADEDTAPASRRWYAADDRSALDDIKNWEGRNRAEYRAV